MEAIDNVPQNHLWESEVMKIKRRNLLKHTFMLPFVAVFGAVLIEAASKKQPAGFCHRRVVISRHVDGAGFS